MDYIEPETVPKPTEAPAEKPAMALVASALATTVLNRIFLVITPSYVARGINIRIYNKINVLKGKENAKDGETFKS